MEITVRREDIHTHRSLATGGPAHHTGPQKEAPGRAGGGDGWGRWARNFISFLWKETGKATYTGL